MPIKKLRRFLDENNVKYAVISHSCAYTSQEIAQSSHVSGKELAKTVILRLDGELTMIVVPASKHVDFELLKEEMDGYKVELAKEEEFIDKFPDCEIGAMPPFGRLYGLDLIIAKGLGEEGDIAFNAGNHRELIKMKFDDYMKLAKPKVMDLTFYAKK